MDDLLQISSFGVNFFVLRDAKGLYLIDGGFVGGRRALRRALRQAGWEREAIVGIILTHGHLDHILNVGRVSEDTGAWIAAPRLDSDHYQGKPCYRGASRVTGVLEAIGRPLLGFKPFVPSRLLDDGDTIDVWGGLRVVHLPGHTAGHSGLYCERRKLLFCGDLFASYGRWSHLPPRIFNANGAAVKASIGKALELDLDGVLPNHAGQGSAHEHLERLRGLHQSLSSGRD